MNDNLKDLMFRALIGLTMARILLLLCQFIFY